MDSRATAWLPMPLACAAFAWLAGALVLLGLAPMRGTATTTFVALSALLLVPGFLFATALRLHTAWHSAWSGVATSFALGAGVTLPLAWLVRALGWPLESGALALVALELLPLAATAYLARTPQGPQLMLGDVTHTRWGWNNGVEPGTFSEDQPRSVVSLQRLKELAATHPTVQAHPGHQSLKGAP